MCVSNFFEFALEIMARVELAYADLQSAAYPVGHMIVQSAVTLAKAGFAIASCVCRRSRIWATKKPPSGSSLFGRRVFGGWLIKIDQLGEFTLVNSDLVE